MTAPSSEAAAAALLIERAKQIARQQRPDLTPESEVSAWCQDEDGAGEWVCGLPLWSLFLGEARKGGSA